MIKFHGLTGIGAIAGAAFFGVLALSASPAGAAIVWDIDPDVFCTGDHGVCDTDKLAGRATFTFEDDLFGGDDVIKLTILLENNSTFDSSKLTAIAFNLPGDGDSVVDFDTGDFTLVEGGHLPPGGPFDICIYADKKCLGGRPFDGVSQGDSVLFTILIDADPVRNAAEYEAAFTPNPVTFRFQAVTDAELGLDDASIKVGGSTPPDDDIPVPEPGTLAVLGIGLLALAAASRRRSRLA